MDYYQKYLKYKQKYFKLKQIGGKKIKVTVKVTEEVFNMIKRWSVIPIHPLNLSDITYAELARYGYVLNKKNVNQRRFSSIPQPIPDAIQIAADDIIPKRIPGMITDFNNRFPTPTPFNIYWTHYENNCSANFLNLAARLTQFFKKGDKDCALDLIKNCLIARSCDALQFIKPDDMLYDKKHHDIILWMNDMHNTLVSITKEEITNYCAEYKKIDELEIICIIEG